MREGANRMQKLINVGYGNNINIDKVLAIVNAESAPSRRLIKNAKEKGGVVDATEGNKTAAIIVMESDKVVLSAISADTIRKRINTPKE